MSYLIRVSLPDVPGSLGQLAEAFGIVDADINSVDIVETSHDGTVTDDIVVTLPTGVMVDTLITAVASVDGAEVDSIRPFTGRVDRRGLAGRITGPALLVTAVGAGATTTGASGRGGLLHARIGRIAQALGELRQSDQHREQATAFIAETEPRLADLAAAVRAAEPLPYAGFEPVFNRRLNFNFRAQD